MASSTHSSIYVAPLQISKGRPRRKSSSSNHSRRSSPSVSMEKRSHVRTRMKSRSPSFTKAPHQRRSQLQQDMFPSYLRAFYPFHPTCDETSSTVTLPLEQGDIVLVHSVHTNGWADGTLLSSGARGWLPTNYCEVYDEEPTHVMMKALTKFWDMIKGTSRVNLMVFGDEDFLRGLVAGIRCLLVSSDAKI